MVDWFVNWSQSTDQLGWLVSWLVGCSVGWLVSGWCSHLNSNLPHINDKK